MTLNRVLSGSTVDVCRIFFCACRGGMCSLELVSTDGFAQPQFIAGMYASQVMLLYRPSLRNILSGRTQFSVNQLLRLKSGLAVWV